MNLDQTKQKAKNGCVTSAVQLAKYYYSEDTEEAVKWANLAAREKHVCGAYWMAMCLQKQIRCSNLSNEQMSEKFREYYYWAEKAYAWFLVNRQGSDQFQKRQLHKLCEDAAFVRANQLYQDGDYRNALLLLRRETSRRCYILAGLCLLDHYRKDDRAVEEDFFSACANLSEIVRVQIGADAIYEEERVYTLSALQYSKFRRTGLYPEDAKPSTKEAYSILCSIRNMIRNEELQKMLDDEMSHYRKNFLGRYKYFE